MTAPEPAIVADRLTKTYRLYRRPGYRLMDLLGICPERPDYFTEHAAVRDVTLQVDRGQKVAIIGRNGAGKSTLLKLVAGIIRPTAGRLTVNRRISNLLQLGTGFHPEFTGRQNVYATLAHQGIAGPAADRAFDEVVAFAEIGHYIDQPMKTYSSGMSARLMFSSVVMLKPEILIVDEILGVGDAYFSHKSFQFMRDLCAQAHTTLLLVTHDIYSAMNLCERFIWIDRGRVKFDGDARSAVAMYESSVKEQEERALRQRAAATVSQQASGEPWRAWHALVRTRTGFALSAPLAIESLALVGTNGATHTLSTVAPSGGWNEVAEGVLGPAQIVEGRHCRVLRTHGSIYHKAEWVIGLPGDFVPASARVAWNHQGQDPVELAVFADAHDVRILAELAAGAGWQERTFAASDTGGELQTPAQTDYGTGNVRVASVQMLDAAGEATTTVTHGDPLTFRIGLEIRANLPVREITLVVGMSRLNTPYVAHVVNHALQLPDSAGDCLIDVHLHEVKLGSGTWYVRVNVAEPGLFTRPAVKYFAVDDGWHHMRRRSIQLDVLSRTHLDSSGCFMVHDATFDVHAGEPALDGKSTTHVRE